MNTLITKVQRGFMPLAILLLAGAFLMVGILTFASQGDVHADDPECEDMIFVEDEEGVVDEIQQAIDSACTDATIMVGTGTYTGAIIAKPVNIIGSGDATVIDKHGWQHPTAPWNLGIAFLLKPGAEGTEISNMTLEEPFMGVSAGIKGFGFEPVNDIKVSHLTIKDPGFFGIATHGCSGWKITHNKIDGMKHAFSANPPFNFVKGIALSGKDDGPSNYNLVAFNEINHTGAEAAFGRYVGINIKSEPHAIVKNKVVNNQVAVAVTGIDSEHSVVGIQFDNLTLDDSIVATENKIMGNDCRGSVEPIVVSPEALLDQEYKNVVEGNLVGDAPNPIFGHPGT